MRQITLASQGSFEKYPRRHIAYAAVASVVLSPVLRFLSESGLVPLGSTHEMTWLICDNLAMGDLIALLAGLFLLIAGIPFGILPHASLLRPLMETAPFELIFSGLLLFSHGGRCTHGLPLEPPSPLPRLH